MGIRSFALALAAMMALFVLSASSRATITVTAGAGATIVTSSVTNGSTGKIVDVSAYGSPGGLILVQATTANERIERVRVTPQSNPPFTASQLNLTLVVQGQAGTSGSFEYVGIIQRLGTNGDLIIGLVEVAGTIGDPANPTTNSIVGQSIGIVRASGDIAARIESTGSSQFPGNIGTVHSTGARILGDIVANGSIATEITAASSIGTTTRTVTVDVNTDILKIQATEIYATIGSNTPGGGSLTALGTLSRLVTTSGAFTGQLAATSISGGNGSEEGILTAGALPATVSVSGTVSKNIKVGGNLSGTMTLSSAFGSSRKLLIGGSLSGTLNLPSSGLAGQVIVNANNAGGAWSGTVNVGGTALTSSTYATTASTLGGGSIGVVPYKIHLESCSPAYSRSGSIPEFSGDNCGTLTVRWYGPAEYSGSTPLSVYFTDGSSYDDATGYFSIVQDSGDPREFTVTPNPSNLVLDRGLYFVAPWTDLVDYPYTILYCRNSDLTVSDVPVASGESYTFEMTSNFFRAGSGGDEGPSAADADCDGLVTSADISAFLALYHAANTNSATSECPGHTADANGDNSVNAADIVAFASAWFAAR